MILVIEVLVAFIVGFIISRRARIELKKRRQNVEETVALTNKE